MTAVDPGTGPVPPPVDAGISERADTDGPESDERRRIKRKVRAVLGIGLAALAVVIVVVVSSTMAAVTSSEETAEVFNDAAVLPPDLIDAVVWEADLEDLPRPMEPLTRVDVTTSWLRAWEQLRIVSETGDASGVEVYFSSSAREAVIDRSQDWGGSSVRQLGHRLQLTFYSEDGQVLGLRSLETELERTSERDGRAVASTSTESYEAVMVLEDGNWRVHHWVRRSFDQEPALETN